MQESMEFLRLWHSEQKQYRENGSTGYDKYFLAGATYHNLRVGICGFLHYAESILKLPDGPKYVPFLHSNSSVIEALFSQMRGMNRDKATTYESGLGMGGKLCYTAFQRRSFPRNGETHYVYAKRA